MPFSRNDLIFDMRKSEEAEGDNKMMGSGRRTGAFGFRASDGLFAIFAAAGWADLRAKNGPASLRTCEKS